MKGNLGRKLISLSNFLFAISLPTSMALDNIAASIGLIGILTSITTQGKFNKLPIKPLSFLLIPEIVETIIRNPLKIFKTDLTLHLIPFFTISQETRQHYIKKFLAILSAASIILSLSIIFEAFTWQNIKHINLDSIKFHADVIRAHGLFNHPLTTGGVVFLLFTLFTACSLHFRKTLYIITSFFLMIGLILNGSRSYWLGLSVSLLLIALFITLTNKKKGRNLIFIVSLILFSTIIVKIPFVEHRIGSITNLKTNWSNIDRLMLWNSHLKAFLKDYSLEEKLFGAGYNADNYAWKHFPSSFKKITGETPPPKEILKIFYIIIYCTII